MRKYPIAKPFIGKEEERMVLNVLKSGNLSLGPVHREFEKEFAKLLASLKIPQYFSRIKTPKDNPVCERFNRTLKEEFLRQGNYTSEIQEFNRRLSQWLIKYNTFRPHQSLKYLTPFEYHFKRLNQKALVHDVVI